MRALLALATVAVLGTTAHAREVSYAIVIGNNAPPTDATGAGLAELHYADDDAVRYDLLFAQFAKVALLSTLDDATQKRYPQVAGEAVAPSLAELRRVVADLAPQMQRDRRAGDEPVLYFAFSGHGALSESGAAFLVLTDGRLTQQVLFDELLAALPSPRVHLIIDACHAGGVVGVRGGSFFDKQAEGQTATASPAEVLAITGGSVLDRYPNVGVITATTLANETHEWSAYEAGVFSYEVLSGLSGAADANGDHAIEYSELQAFVASANRSIENPRAVPMMVAEAPRANRHAPLVRLADLRQSSLLRGDLGAWGHFWIERADGQRLLDAHVSREHAAAIALPSGVPLYLRTEHGEAQLIGHGKEVAARSVRLEMPRVAVRGGIDADYRDNLFATAFGPTYYRGYVDSHGGVAVAFDVDMHVTGELADPEPVAVPLEDDPGRWWRRGSYALGVLALGAGAIAVTAGVSAIEARRDFNAAPTQDAAYGPAQDYHDATLSFAISGAVTAALAAGTWAMFHHGRHLSLAAAASTHSGAVSVTGEF